MNTRQRNNVQCIGDGPTTMVFAHGFGCDRDVWRLLSPDFAARYRLVLFDLVGSGASDLTAYDRERYSSLDGYADDLLEIVDEFGRGPVIFVGHSVSAMIGVIAHIKAPDRFKAHVMLAPSPCYIDDGEYVGGFTREDIGALLDALEENYLGWSSKMAPVIMGAPDRPALGASLTQSFCRTNPEIAKHFARVTFLSDTRADVAKLGAPTLIIQSTDDVIAPRVVGEYLHRQLPSSTLKIIENVGHCPHLSAPAACAEAMNGFLLTL
ncbi:MAG TPA: alpha/beta hydrolase [Burkholderiaceae bacterium]|jgi:sigma-B regulation protein RsbQ